MIKNIKESIQYFIEKEGIKNNHYKTEDLISFALYFVYRNKYFNHLYDNSIIVKNEIENTYRLITPQQNYVDSAKFNKLHTLICSPTEESIFEDQFLSIDDCSYLLTPKSINQINKVLNVFNNSKSPKDLLNKFNNLTNEDMDSLFIFHAYYPDVFNYDSQINLYLQENILLETNKSKKYKTELPFFENNDIVEIIESNLNKKNYLEEKKEFLTYINKKMNKIKPLKDVIEDCKNELLKITNYVKKEYPYIKEEPNLENVSFHFKKKKDLNINDFVSNNFFLFSPLNPDDSNILEGLIYLNNSIQKDYNHNYETFYLFAEKNNEIIGVLSLQQRLKDSPILKIGEICIKNSYRNKGLSKKIYQNLAKVSIDNNFIIYNTNYTTMGKRYLPKMKETVREEHPDFMLIDSEVSNIFENISIERSVARFNYLFIDFITSNSSEFIKKNYKLIKDEYKNQYNEIKKSSEEYSNDLVEKRFQSFLKNVKNKEKSVYKLK